MEIPFGIVKPSVGTGVISPHVVAKLHSRIKICCRIPIVPKYCYCEESTHFFFTLNICRKC